MGMFEVESWAVNKTADKLSKQLFSEKKKKRNLDKNNDLQESSRKDIKVDQTDGSKKSKKRKHIYLDDDHELNSNIKQQKKSQTNNKEFKEDSWKKGANKTFVNNKKKSTTHSNIKIAANLKAKSPRNKYKHLALKKTEMKEGANSISIKAEESEGLPVNKSPIRVKELGKNKGRGQTREETSSTLSSQITKKTLKSSIKVQKPGKNKGEGQPREETSSILRSQITNKKSLKGQTSTVDKLSTLNKDTKVDATVSPVKENKRKRKKKNNPKKNKYRHLIIKKDTNGEEGDSLKDLKTDKNEQSDVKKVTQIVSNKSKSANKEKSALSKSERKVDEDDHSDQTHDIKPSKRTKSECSLKQRMNVKLNAARFRYLNEKLYTQTGAQSLNLFQDDVEAFQVYHDGFQSQVLKWPSHPLDTIIKYISTRSPSLTVADFGCGDAKLAQTVSNNVHSFDLVALNKFVTPCDMSKVPIPAQSVDVAVFCLSLMGTNLVDYLKEANRVLKVGGILKVAEVCSRIRSLPSFIEQLKTLGFTLLHQNTSNKMFVLVDFKKTSKPTGPSPQLTLMPCVYKKR